MNISRHWSLDSFTTDKIKLLQAISKILLLRDESPILLLTDLKPEKELRFTHHRHFIFLRHHTSKFFSGKRISSRIESTSTLLRTRGKTPSSCGSGCSS